MKFLGELKAIFLPLLSAERVVFNVFQMTYVGPRRPKKKKLKNMGEEVKKKVRDPTGRLMLEFHSKVY